jgi:hypothetical protein
MRTERSEPEVRAELRAWVRKKAKGLDITDQTPLFQQRVLRSVHVPELLILLERLRGAPIDVERLRPGDLQSIEIMMERLGAAP